MSVKVIELKDALDKSAACKDITAQLPEWFGLAGANAQYAVDAETYPALAVVFNGKVAGLLVYKRQHDDVLNEDVMDIHWLGVMPEFHGRGFGTALVDSFNAIAKAGNIKTVTVETLNPKAKDQSYLKTHAFYEKLGFKTFHEFSYGEHNPMVKMKKVL